MQISLLSGVEAEAWLRKARQDADVRTLDTWLRNTAGWRPRLAQAFMAQTAEDTYHGVLFGDGMTAASAETTAQLLYLPKLKTVALKGAVTDARSVYYVHGGRILLSPEQRPPAGKKPSSYRDDEGTVVALSHCCWLWDRCLYLDGVCSAAFACCIVAPPCCGPAFGACVAAGAACLDANNCGEPITDCY